MTNMTKLSKSRFLDLPLLLPFLVTGAFPFCGIFHQLLLSHLQPLVIRVDVPSFFAHGSARESRDEGLFRHKKEQNLDAT